MLKQLMVMTVSLAALALFSCTAPKKKAPEGPVGGAEGGSMDANIGSQDMSFDATGSDSGKIAGLKSVRFDYDSSTLTAEARKQLADNAEWIKANPKATVQVEGHCDSRGSVEYNLALGERRAKAVKTYLMSLGIESKRLTIISYGEEKPLDNRDTEDAYAKNRRANFVPLGQ